MKRILSLLVIISLVSCASSKNGQSGDLAGNWELSLFPNDTKSFEEIFSQRRPGLQFETSANKVTGTTGCNRLSGSYTVNGDEFRFGNNIITTKMACPGYEESYFMDALNRVNRYELSGTALRLMQGNNLVMSFTRK
jgi:heat shock protein HslJ